MQDALPFFIGKNMERIIVAINGTIGSGKDTFSAEFIEAGYHRMSFAETLKDAVSVIFGWDREMLEGSTEESRKLRETRDEYWSNKLGGEVTPRWVLQNFGTDCIRKHFNDNMWVYSLEKRMSTVEGNIIITDCRFPNEIAMLLEQGAHLIEVQRKLPEWYNKAKAYNQLVAQGKIVKKPVELESVHPSEWAWIGMNTNAIVVQNNGTVEDLHNKASYIRHGIEDTK